MRSYYVTVLLATALLGNQNAQAQSTTANLSTAHRALLRQEYAAASTTYQQALKRLPGTARDYYRAAQAAAQNQELKAALRLLRQAIDTGYFSAEDIVEEENFASLTTQAGWNRLLARARIKQQRHEAAFDPQLVAVLRKISYQDQHYRHIAMRANKKFGPGSSVAVAADNQQNYFDLLAIRQVDSLIERHGYPGKKQVGEYQKEVAFLVIQHHPNEKYLPLLMAAAAQGEMQQSAFALFTDRIKSGKGEKQLYGSQLGAAVNGHYTLDPIEDEVNVNVRRAEIGMEPLENYLQQFGITYQVPTAAGNPNPPELYTAPRDERAEAEEKSDVELVGSYEALYASLRYPTAARQRNVSGYVTVQLTIDKDGVPKDVVVVQGMGHGCDEEAVRAMQAARYTNSAGQDHQIRVRLPFPYKAEAGKSEK